jgi:hypothetical protein
MQQNLKCLEIVFRGASTKVGAKHNLQAPHVNGGIKTNYSLFKHPCKLASFDIIAP